MSEREPDCYLSSRETRDEWANVRACWVQGKIAAPHKAYLWIKIHPPVIGQPYGLGEDNIGDVLVTPHESGREIKMPLNRDIPIYIYRVLDESVFSSGTFDERQVEMVAWGELYPTLEAASER